jgi:predicted Abi (CAAX) family protease
MQTLGGRPVKAVTVQLGQAQCRESVNTTAVYKCAKPRCSVTGHHANMALVWIFG